MFDLHNVTHVRSICKKHFLQMIFKDAPWSLSQTGNDYGIIQAVLVLD